MGFGGISPWSLLIILVIILLLFGTKRLRNMGGDLGGAFKSFKQSMKDGGDDDKKTDADPDATTTDTAKVIHDSADEGRVIDAEVKQKSNHKV